MPFEVTVPKFGLTMQDANIVRWLKKEGEQVNAGETLLEIETEKITSEIEAPVSGTVTKILYPEGQTALVGEVIALIEPSA
jgi:pyruvate/2-oxoglutarate dehydrogenase complex dihydrolipoamide acyltransferase (E2) component